MNLVAVDRVLDVDKEHDEDLALGLGPSEHPGELKLVEAVVLQALADCERLRYQVVRGKKVLHADVCAAWTWLMETAEGDEQVPLTFAWCMRELGWQAEKWQALLKHQRAFIAKAVAQQCGV